MNPADEQDVVLACAKNEFEYAKHLILRDAPLEGARAYGRLAPDMRAHYYAVRRTTWEKLEQSDRDQHLETARRVLKCARETILNKG